MLTYRSDEGSTELRHCLAEFDREHLAQDLSLQRLDRADVDAMLQAIFAMHQAVHTGLLESLYQLTEGNPFFIFEQARRDYTQALRSAFYGQAATMPRPDRGSAMHSPSRPRSLILLCRHGA